MRYWNVDLSKLFCWRRLVRRMECWWIGQFFRDWCRMCSTKRNSSDRIDIPSWADSLSSRPSKTRTQVSNDFRFSASTQQMTEHFSTALPFISPSYVSCASSNLSGRSLWAHRRQLVVPSSQLGGRYWLKMPRVPLLFWSSSWNYSQLF